ncbi:DNA/RNA helicase domain-containing protein [Kitasatospora sp. NPDC001664]
MTTATYLYRARIADADREVNRRQFVDECADRFRSLHGTAPNSSELASWRAGWPILTAALKAAGLGELHIVLEYGLPGTGQRIDALLLGADPDGRLAPVVVELKQWTRALTRADYPGLVQVGGRVTLHPARQVGLYASYLQGWVTDSGQDLRVRGTAILHNADEHLVEQLRSAVANGPSADFPLLGRSELERHTAEALATHLSCDSLAPVGDERAEAFLRTAHRPSATFLALASSAIEGHPSFRLIEEQDVALQRIRGAVLRYLDDRALPRPLVIVTGGPGTGKTAVAARTLGELCRLPDADPRLLFPSATMSHQLRRAVGPDHQSLIHTLMDQVPRTVDDATTVILDEAHRAQSGGIHGDSRLWTRLLERAGSVVVFLDENQIIRPTEGITVTELRALAGRLGREVTLVELRGQFRNNGSADYHRWVDAFLSPTGSAAPWTGSSYDLAHADPGQFSPWVDGHIHGGRVARISAGYCWHWSRKEQQPLPLEVEVTWHGANGDEVWARPWNYAADRTALDVDGVPGRPYWATDEGGSGQVGCVYTAQGLEYSHSVVILGDDLAREKGRWVARPAASHDKALRHLTPDQYLRYALNTYRVLLTRGTEATRVFSTEPSTQAYLRTVLPAHTD